MVDWTIEELGWASWLDPVRAPDAEQEAVLAASGAHARTSDYVLTLLHNPAALRERTRLYNACMYGTKGLPRAERELAALAESRVNGCPYCASVHGRLFVQLAKQPEIVEAIFRDGVDTAAVQGRARAILDYAAALTPTPPRATPAHVAALRDAGLTDEEILDLTHAIAMFAWANRLMQTLGEPVEMT